LKIAFGIQDQQEITARSELKQKLEELISTGKYATLKEIAKVTGYSHSYVCRVLKHKK
jgi:DNA-directed RNA polymerase specialized sigma subunit